MTHPASKRITRILTSLAAAAVLGSTLTGMGSLKNLRGGGDTVDYTGILAGDHREDTERARDAFRHPAETLNFFGLSSDMSVAEIWPGGGWYMKVIAPAITTGGGTYYAVTPWDPESDDERVQGAIKRFDEHVASDVALYGSVKRTLMRGPKNDIAPEGSLDMVLTFRNVHNWMTGNPETDYSDEYMAAFFKALKPGGILGVVEHRAPADREPDPAAASGYVQVAQVKAMAAAAGFEFLEASEVNANPKDTADHPFGVWTLPPSRRSAERGQEMADGFDRAGYDAVGESDRMTLKFRKPKA